MQEQFGAYPARSGVSWKWFCSPWLLATGLQCFQKRERSVEVAPAWCGAADTAQSINEDAQIPSPAVSTSSSNTLSWRVVPKPAAISESTLNTATRELHLQCKYKNTKFLQNTLQIR